MVSKEKFEEIKDKFNRLQEKQFAIENNLIAMMSKNDSLTNLLKITQEKLKKKENSMKESEFRMNSTIKDL